MVGMAVVPDALLCHQLGMNVIGLALITNMAAGINNQKLSHQEVMDASDAAKNDFTALIKEILKGL